MLILTRKINEALMLGQNGEIVIKLLNIKGREVKIGISAPRNVPINREEVFHRIMEAQQVKANKTNVITHLEKHKAIQAPSVKEKASSAT